MAIQSFKLELSSCTTNMYLPWLELTTCNCNQLEEKNLHELFLHCDNLTRVSRRTLFVSNLTLEGSLQVEGDKVLEDFEDFEDFDVEDGVDACEDIADSGGCMLFVSESFAKLSVLFF